MRLGLFLSRRHGEVSNIVDVDALASHYSDLAAVRVYDHFFGETEQQDMLTCVQENRLDSVVLAGNSANQFELGKQGRAFVQALRSKGVNQNRIVFTNLCEQVALIHSDQPETANKKARLLVNTALTKAKYCHNIESLSIQPVRAVLVLGATERAVIAAKYLLSKEYAVYMVEKSESWRVKDPDNGNLAPLIEYLKNDSNANLMFESTVTDLSGWHGDYNITVHSVHGDKQFNVGGIVLCVGKDREWIEQLRPHLRLDTDREGLLVNVDGNRTAGKTKEPGMWLIPTEDSDAPLDDLSTDVGQMVKSVMTSLNRPTIEHPVLVSEVDETRCGGCGTCIKTCAFSASSIDAKEKTSHIDAKRCKGCGNCVTACPTNARDLVTFPTLYVNRAIEILSEGSSPNGDPKVLAFLCKNSGYMAADAAGKPANHLSTGNYSPNVMPLRIECGGNIDTVYILKALKEGFDGIAMVVCKDNHCHNVVGNTDMERRIGLLRAVLRSRNLDDNRLRIIHTFGHKGKRLNKELKAFSDELKLIKRH